MAPVIQTEIAFKPSDLLNTRYEGWIADRMEINIEKRLLKLDLDMIVEPFVNRPGKQWWAGEHVGKYLHAATHAWRFTQDERLASDMKSVVQRLIDTQLSNGYLGTYNKSDQFAQGDGLNWDGPIWDVWTHKYNLIGLLSYYKTMSYEPALDACRRMADLMNELFVVQNRSLRLASAHMGMAATSVLEPIAILYQITGEQRYLGFCHAIVNAWEDESNPETWMYEDGCQLLRSLLEHGNVYKTANRKAYEMLSNLVGLIELYRVDSDQRYLIACINAWNDIATRRLYITGTTSYFEQFNQDDRLPPGLAVGEGCVTVTWLQLTHHLLQLTGEVQYADELERTIYNALPAAQSPLTGEVSYFSPLLGHKDFNGQDIKLHPPISCCSSSIPRGLALSPFFASGTLNDKPALLQYIPGTHALVYGRGDEQKSVSLHIHGDYPHNSEFEIEVEPEQDSYFAIILRVPVWATNFRAMVGDRTYLPASNRLLEIERDWSKGDKVRVSIPLEVRQVPDGDKTTQSIAFVRGPQVLATDTAIESCDGALGSDWWGDALYSSVVVQDGVEKTLHLVTFADAGQNKEDYAVLHDGIQPQDE